MTDGNEIKTIKDVQLFDVRLLEKCQIYRMVKNKLCSNFLEILIFCV